MVGTAIDFIGLRELESAFAERRLQMGMYERLVLEDWLMTTRCRYERVGFNVPLWLNPPGRDVVSGEFWVNADYKPDYRIDFIGGRNGIVDLVEVKEAGNVTAIGQLLMYQMLFIRSYWGFKELRLVLVAGMAPEPVKFACEHLGIRVEIAGAEVLEKVRRGRSGSGVMGVELADELVGEDVA